MQRMPTKDELIEKIARTLWYAMCEGEKPMDLGSYDELHPLGRLPYINEAALVLQALLKTFPPIDIFNYISPEYYADYYKQLLAMKNEK